MSGIIKIIIVIVVGCVAVTGGLDSVMSNSGYDYGSSSYETTDYCEEDDVITDDDSEVGYEEEMPDKVFEPSSLVGKWVDDSDSTNPNILEIYKDGDEYTYYYYGITPGDGNGLKIAVETTEWEYCSGSILMNPYRGNFECWNSSNTDTYVKFFYIDEDTIEHANNGSKFYRNDDYEYVNPYAETSASAQSEEDDDDGTIEGCWPPEDCDCGNHDDSADDYTSEEYTAMYSLDSLLQLAFFNEDEFMDAIIYEGTSEDIGAGLYAIENAEFFDKEGVLEYALEDDEVSYLGWAYEFDYSDEYAEEDSLELYNTIIKMLEEAVILTEGSEDCSYDDYMQYVFSYEGKAIYVERTLEDGVATIYFSVYA